MRLPNVALQPTKPRTAPQHPEFQFRGFAAELGR
jgi:hypothetical protein